MKPGERKPRKKLGVQDGYKSARNLGFLQIGILFVQLFFNHILCFKGTIRVKTNFLSKELPNRMGDVSIGNFNDLTDQVNISIHFWDWSPLIDTYYFLHLFCSNIKYGILAWVCFKIADLFKSASEKRIFEDRNIRIIQFIGFALLSIPFFDNLSISIMTEYVRHHAELFSKLNLDLSPTFEVFTNFNSYMWYFFYAQIFYLAIIEIFRQGLALKSENDLTV